MTLDIQNRSGWPTELRFLLEQYPREVWPTHVNLGALTRFWLDIHADFRRFGGTLGAATVDLREGRVTHERFGSWFAPRLQMFLSHLNGHHQIEDFQFFPLFGDAEPRLVRGFEVLERDHEVIHGTMDGLAEAAKAFLLTPAADTDRLRAICDEYADATERLLKLLDRHLADEEDLIVPLILDRGEHELGV